MIDKLLPTRISRPLYGVANSRAIETAALAAHPGQQLMERAGLAVAKLALALLPSGPTGTVWIVCGPGNNGGDGLVAARLLRAAGLRVRVSLIDADRPAPADAAAALRAALDAGVDIARDAAPPDDVALLIDALLGLGLSRPPGATMAAAIEALNALAAPVLAVDLPSGLLADTGRPAGPVAVRADHTLSLLTLKPGLFTADGRAHAGELWFDALGTQASLPADALLLGHDCMAGWHGRHRAASHSSHKGSQGDVLVLGGAAGMRGAALLAARAALAAGAGRVYGCLLADQGVGLDPQRPELMHWPRAWMAQESALWRDKTVVAGCGGGKEIAAELPPLLREAQRLVLDADALNALAADAALGRLLDARGLPTLLTPHPLEASRLLGSSAADVQADRLAAAQQLAERHRCTVILKGSGSIIATAGQRPAINSSGSAALATAGSGDVLAGWIAGLWARWPTAEPHALACAAVYWHGLAGQSQAAGPLRAADLVERMHALHDLP
jgi:hydroxyethylthiazole kinase-like uncharacterized protein yjeF